MTGGLTIFKFKKLYPSKMKCLLAVLLLCISCHSVVSKNSLANKNVTRTSRRLSGSPKTSSTTSTTVPSFTVEDFSRYVDSKGDSETVVLDISEVTESAANFSNDSLIEYYDDYYYADDANEINTSQRPNDKNSSTANDGDRSNKNVEREAHVVHDGNYAYYRPSPDEWHPVAPPPPVLAPAPVILPHQVHHHPPPIVIHPAPPTTTEDSHILHYTINYQVSNSNFQRMFLFESHNLRLTSSSETGRA